MISYMYNKEQNILAVIRYDVNDSIVDGGIVSQPVLCTVYEVKNFKNGVFTLGTTLQDFSTSVWFYEESESEVDFSALSKIGFVNGECIIPNEFTRIA